MKYVVLGNYSSGLTVFGEWDENVYKSEIYF